MAVLGNRLIAKYLHLSCVQGGVRRTGFLHHFSCGRITLKGLEKAQEAFVCRHGSFLFRCIALKHMIYHHGFPIPFHIKNCGSRHNNLWGSMVLSCIWLESCDPPCRYVQGFSNPADCSWSILQLACFVSKNMSV